MRRGFLEHWLSPEKGFVFIAKLVWLHHREEKTLCLSKMEHKALQRPPGCARSRPIPECILGANLRLDAVGDNWALSHES